jgi:hypothetical protein
VLPLVDVAVALQEEGMQVRTLSAADLAGMLAPTLACMGLHVAPEKRPDRYRNQDKRIAYWYGEGDYEDDQTRLKAYVAACEERMAAAHAARDRFTVLLVKDPTNGECRPHPSYRTSPGLQHISRVFKAIDRILEALRRLDSASREANHITPDTRRADRAWAFVRAAKFILDEGWNGRGLEFQRTVNELDFALFDSHLELAVIPEVLFASFPPDRRATILLPLEQRLARIAAQREREPVQGVVEKPTAADLLLVRLGTLLETEGLFWDKERQTTTRKLAAAFGCIAYRHLSVPIQWSFELWHRTVRQEHADVREVIALDPTQAHTLQTLAASVGLVFNETRRSVVAGSWWARQDTKQREKRDHLHLGM